ncbi:amidohydrolase family protein [Nonomuraea sp. K274]|uniref:Amidohydrolase family protein n=1 Tax=Nonomuraea cypriaca TaxID=1187855 RepID=A0A931A7V1_9ACTN|nr:amidohydrolase family protein [Nonomuraea cypriaca]
MPGFVDTHHHQFETALRSFLANGILFDDGSGSPSADPNYAGHILQKFTPQYRTQDVHINVLFAGLSQLDAGVTTVHDTSQIPHSPQHTDAAIQALIDTGRRSVLQYAEGDGRAESRYPEDARRVRDQWFSSDDQLVSMIMGGELYSATEDVYTRAWKLGRELGLKISAHAVSGSKVRPILDDLARGTGGAGNDLGVGQDNLFFHMTGVSDLAWERFRDAGVQVSVAFPIEMAMRHGTPPILKMQELGMEPSLSSDVETTMAADSFTLMRSAMTMQRMLVNQMILEQGDFTPPNEWPKPAEGTPALLTVRDVLRYATVNGAEHLGLGRKTGTLTPGKEADIVLLDATALNVTPLNNVPGAVVSLMDRSNVETVIVAGKVRKWKGRLVDGVRHAAGRVMQVVELSRAGDPRQRHLRVDRPRQLQVGARVEAGGHVVHGLAPGPERAGATLDEAAQGPVEGMRVCVGQPWHGEPAQHLRPGRGREDPRPHRRYPLPGRLDHDPGLDRAAGPGVLGVVRHRHASPSSTSQAGQKRAPSSSPKFTTATGRVQA